VDFCSGIFGKQYATGIENNVYNKILEATSNGDRVVFTMDTHPAENYTKTREGKRVKPHGDPVTEGWQL